MKAYVPIMRGCNNLCSYCVVPFTRGREKSRPCADVMKEVLYLKDRGIKEITLLGQNVNSYCDQSGANDESEVFLPHQNSAGFRETDRHRDKGAGIRFSQLLENVAKAAPETRIRFMSPHPKDFPDTVLDVIRRYPNIGKR